ncbi:MAG: hypothetical protein Q8Q23_04420 [bacterium]|nr:hypothetical protein [bacterium]
MSQFFKTSILILAAAFILSGCLKAGEIPVAKDRGIAAQNEQVAQVPVGDLAKWQTLARESEGFSMKLPQGWWWQRDVSAEQTPVKYFFGFTMSEEALNKGRDYPVELLAVDITAELRYDGYLKVVSTQDDLQYILRGAFQYRDIINAMAESFELLGTEINDLGLQSEVSTKDWETYRNEEYGFEVSMPKDWVKQKEAYYSPNRAKQLIGDFVPPPTLSIKVIPEFNNTDDYISEIESCIENVSDVVINNNSAKFFKYTCTAVHSDDIAVVIDGKLVRYSSYLQAGEDRGLVDKIILTFKFIDSNDTADIDTSDWQTYRNGEYGFEFQYPKEWILNSVNQFSKIADIKSENFVSNASELVKGVLMEVLVQENWQNFNFDNLDENLDYEFALPFKDKSVVRSDDGIKLHKLIFYDDESLVNEAMLNTQILTVGLVSNNKFILTLRFSAVESDQSQLINVYQRIISSIKEI